MGRSMHLAVFAQAMGAAQGVWRSPRTVAGTELSLGHWAHLAQTAEAGCFDAFFVADALTLSPGIAGDATLRPDPVALLSALSVATSRIGLIGTSSTTYNDPFTVARQFATLDHLSEGRAGWNVVTTAIAAAAENYGTETLPDHEDRYERGEEFVDVVLGLWDCWEPDAVVADRSSGVFADLDRIRSLDHRGRHFRVRGPLTVPRSPQGRLPLAQAGSSGPGMRLGARVADLVFTTQVDPEASLAFADEMRTLAVAAGRHAGDLKVLPGVTPIVGRTRAEAGDLAAELGSYVSEPSTLQFMAASFGGLDLSSYELDDPFPDLRGQLPAHAGVSRPELFIRTALEERLTLRQLLQRIGLSIGHRSLVGTPDDIADDLQRWFEAGAADGFVVIPADMPAGLTDFVGEVVPRLQARGLFRKRYAGATLRDHLADRPTA
ncbi:FMN-dependent oxidoreductase (nitrilotriacetate monooxygenase family) [Nocardioides sp. SLBN-35]|nr:FMN-dependent oxidoreductase (nitrilotriacetate monooxygenase family) [Nocardioides sp. SLBN-35]